MNGNQSNKPRNEGQRPRTAKLNGSRKNQAKASKLQMQSANPQGMIPVAFVVKPKTPSSPKISQKGDVTIVHHRELLGTITAPVNASGAWGIIPSVGLSGSGVIRANPGSESGCPWLAPFAQNFEYYKFLKLAYSFITRLPTTSTGNIMISPDYDAADVNPPTEIQAASNPESKEGPCYSNFTAVLKESRMNALYKRRAVASDARFMSSNQDAKTVDTAKVCISGDITTASALPAGKLWVEYVVELFSPAQNIAFIGGSAQSGWTLAAVGNANPLQTLTTNAVNANNPLVTFSNIPTGTNKLGVINDALSGGGLLTTFLGGTGLTSASIPTPTITNPGGSPTPLVGFGFPAVNAALTQAAADFIVPSSTKAGATLQLPGAFGGTTNTVFTSMLNSIDPASGFNF